MRENIILKCTECGEENYINTKNKRNHPDRMEVKNTVQDVTKKQLIKKRNKPYGFFSLERNYL